MDASMPLPLDLAHRRFSDASLHSMKTDSSMASPNGPPTPGDSFGRFSSRDSCLPPHPVIMDGSHAGGVAGTYGYLADLGDHVWQLGPQERMCVDTHNTSMDNLSSDDFCGIGDETSFQFSSFSTDLSQDMEFAGGFASHHAVADLGTHGLNAFSPPWSSGSSVERSTVSPSETFHVPEIASAHLSAFDQVSWDLPAYNCLNLQTPPPSPHRPVLRRRTYKSSKFDDPVLSRGVKTGRVQKSRSESASPISIRQRHPCNEVIYIKAADGSTKPAHDAEGNPKICTKTFYRAEHLTRHKKTDGHSRMESETFCPVPDCKKSKNAEKPSAFGGNRRDNLVDHFKKTHCQQSDHNGRNRRIERTEAETYGSFWLQVWDAAQPDQKLKGLARIWKPHGGPDQDPHKVIEFFIANDLRLSPAQLHKRLNHTALEHRILGLLPPRGEQRSSKVGKCRSRNKR